MYIPDTVKTVDSFGLYFKEDNTVLLYTNYETEEQLINVFKAFSSNAIIVMNNKKYYISEDKLINENNEEISNLKTTTPITDFTIGYDNTNIDSNKIYLYETKTESTIYVAITQYADTALCEERVASASFILRYYYDTLFFWQIQGAI